MCGAHSVERTGGYAMDTVSTDQDQGASAGIELITADLDREARLSSDTRLLAAKIMERPTKVHDDPVAMARLERHHRGLDEFAARLAEDAPPGNQVMTHRSPYDRDQLAQLTDAIHHVRATQPRLHVFGATDYRWGWTWKASHQLQPTTDLLQNVLAQDASFSVEQGTAHIDHRVTDWSSELKSLVGFPFTPTVSVGYISIRPYVQYAANGVVDVDSSTAWPDGYHDRARSYVYGQIYLTSTDASGQDARYEGPVTTRASYHHESIGAFAPFNDSGALTVGDGLALEALVLDTRRYVVWVGAYAWAWSAIIPRMATSQASATVDCRMPFTVVEERPL